VTVIGVEPVSLATGMALTPQVEALLPKVVAQLVDELRQLGMKAERIEEEVA
jgi:hydrogenase maturation protease